MALCVDDDLQWLQTLRISRNTNHFRMTRLILIHRHFEADAQRSSHLVLNMMGISENRSMTCEGKFALQIILMATSNLSFCQPTRWTLVLLHLQSHPNDLKTEWENETRPGLGLWTVKWPQQLWTAPSSPPPKTLWITPITLQSDCPPSVEALRTGYKYERHLTESSCCYCHTAKFGPCVQSPRLQVNQLNQQSLIPASQDRFIKDLISVSSCFSQPNHFPRSHATQWQEYQIFPHLPESIRGHHMPQDQIKAVIRLQYIWITHWVCDKGIISVFWLLYLGEAHSTGGAGAVSIPGVNKKEKGKKKLVQNIKTANTELHYHYYYYWKGY